MTRQIETHGPDPRLESELRAQIKEWRQGRATKKLTEALSDAYVALFALVVFGAMLANVLLSAQVSAGQCLEGACVSARTLLPVATWAGLGALALAVSRLIGPVVASAAEGFWLMDAPLNRGRLLANRLFAVVAATAGTGALAGALISLLTGISTGGVIAWAAATGLSAAALTAFAAAEQGAERSFLVRVAEAVFGIVGVGAVLLVVGIAAGWVDLHVSSSAETELAFVVAGLAALLLILALVVARRRLQHLRRVRLTTGGSLASGLAGSFYALDFGLAHDILTEQRARERGQVRPTRGSGTGAGALLLRDLQRLLRRPQVLLGPLIAAVVPYATGALGLGAVTSPLAAVALFLALVPLFGGLRVLARTSGLARMLPMPTSRIRMAQSAIPAAVALAFAIATAPAYVGFGVDATRTLGEALQVSLMTAVAGLLGAIRWVTAKPANYQAPAVASPAGALPTGMIANLVRGFDVVLLVTIPLVFGLPVVISVVLAVVVGAVLITGGIDVEEAQRQQAEQRKAMNAGRDRR
ncbi:DUF6297 family protein [Naumannella halotolerans]|uniref:Uncharacterized protein n=1 Tax=Naumannella halotolerans TaxID=993414 RepID=A0A4R7JBT5_9ACTN|nr:DUF6297 family protein [Naumannella halotolerans]TDT34456.1 hypothetical protein CLV29_2122 [Naumannella halotolerans]